MQSSMVKLFHQYPWYKSMPIDQKINEKFKEIRFRMNVDKTDFGWSNFKLPKTERIRH